MTKTLLAAALVAFTLGACTQEPANDTPPAADAEAADPAPTQAQAPADISIQDIMNDIIVPSADVVWNAVSYRSTPDGVEMVVPQTDEEWQRIRDSAMQLVEAGNLLMVEGRPVGTEGTPLQDEGLEGNLTREQIQGAMETQRAAFNANAAVLQEAAMGAIAAIDARDAEALSNSGGTLDEACEACHTGFWYPAAP